MHCPNIIPKSTIEVLNRLENDEDNRFSWKLTRYMDSLFLTVSCSLRAKTPKKDPIPSEQDSDHSLCEKELENTSLNPCGSSGVLVSSEKSTPAPTSDFDLLNASALLLEFLDTISINSDDDLSSVSVCANCKYPGLDLKRCWRCHTTRYCSVQCQRKD